MQIKNRGQAKTRAAVERAAAAFARAERKRKAMIALGLIRPGEDENGSLGCQTSSQSKDNTSPGGLGDQQSSPRESLGTPRSSSVAPPPQRELEDEFSGSTSGSLFRSSPAPRILKGRQWEPLCGKYPNYFLEGTEKLPPYELTQYSRDIFSSDEAFEEYGKKRFSSIERRAEWYRKHSPGKG